MPDSGGKFQSFKIELWRPSAPNQIYSQNWCSFSMLKLTEFSSAFGRGFTFHYTRHVMKRFIPHVRRARPLNGFENVSNLARIRIEYDLLISWDGYSFFQRTSSVRKSYHEMDLRNGISLGIKEKYIKFGNKLDWVEEVSQRIHSRKSQWVCDTQFINIEQFLGLSWQNFATKLIFATK
jgi:hypothetical protein